MDLLISAAGAAKVTVAAGDRVLFRRVADGRVFARCALAVGGNGHRGYATVLGVVYTFRGDRIASARANTHVNRLLRESGIVGPARPGPPSGEPQPLPVNRQSAPV